MTTDPPNGINERNQQRHKTPTIAEEVAERVRKRQALARNQYADLCYLCSLMVRPGEGHFEKHIDKETGRKWRVKHGIYPGDGRVTCEMAIERAKKEANQKSSTRGLNDNL